MFFPPDTAWFGLIPSQMDPLWLHPDITGIAFALGFGA
jgi:hypothetical protein